MKRKQGLRVQHLTSTPAASVSQLPAGEGARPQPGSQGPGEKESGKSPDVAQRLTGERVEDKVC